MTSSCAATTLSRLRCSARSSNNSPQHFLFNNQQQSQFSAVVGIHYPCRNYNDDDDQQNHKADRSNNVLFHNSLAMRNLNNTTVIGNTRSRLMQQNTQVITNTTIIRQYHTTLPEQRGAAIVLTLGAVAATAKAGQYAVQGYKEWKVAMEEERKRQELEEKNKPKEEESSTHKTTQGDEAKSDSNTAGSSADNSSSQSTGKEANEEGSSSSKRENFFAKFFNLSVGSKYYEGGFEEKMTRKEAALILGVRESSTAKRIKEAHRKLLILNHPDTGGSTYMAGKINEAKELLLKGKK
jgi:hypothetical protein